MLQSELFMGFSLNKNMKTIIIFNKKSREISLTANIELDTELGEAAFMAPLGYSRIVLEEEEYAKLNAKTLHELVKVFPIQ